MRCEERPGLFHRFGLQVCNGTEVKEVSRLGLMAAVVHLLGDDLGAGFHPYRASLVRNRIPRVFGQRRSHNDVDLALWQKQFGVLGRLFVLGGEGLGDIREAWREVARYCGSGTNRSMSLLKRWFRRSMSTVPPPKLQLGFRTTSLR